MNFHLLDLIFTLGSLQKLNIKGNFFIKTFINIKENDMGKKEAWGYLDLIVRGRG
jgi:hypothetical protein